MNSRCVLEYFRQWTLISQIIPPVKVAADSTALKLINFPTKNRHHRWQNPDNSKFIPLSLLSLFSSLLTHSWKMLICDCEDEMEILAKLSHLSGIFIVVCGCYRCRRLLRSLVGTFENFFLSSFSSPPSPSFDVNLFSSHAIVDCMLLAFLIMFSVDGGVKQHNNSVRKKN